VGVRWAPKEWCQDNWSWIFWRRDRTRSEICVNSSRWFAWEPVFCIWRVRTCVVAVQLRYRPFKKCYLIYSMWLGLFDNENKSLILLYKFPLILILRPMSPRDSSIDWRPRLMKLMSLVWILSPSLVWTCQKNKNKD